MKITNRSTSCLKGAVITIMHDVRALIDVITAAPGPRPYLLRRYIRQLRTYAAQPPIKHSPIWGGANGGLIGGARGSGRIVRRCTPRAFAEPRHKSGWPLRPYDREGPRRIFNSTGSNEVGQVVFSLTIDEILKMNVIIVLNNHSEVEMVSRKYLRYRREAAIAHHS